MLSDVNSESAKLNGGRDGKMSSNDTANTLYTSNGDGKSSHAHLHGTDERDVFVISDGVGSSDLNKTTHIINFDRNRDSVDRKLGFCAALRTAQKPKTLLFPAQSAGKSSVLGAVC
jgi:hypothetical protein